jgi:DNA-binding MarR family transcriptional regulator
VARTEAAEDTAQLVRLVVALSARRLRQQAGQELSPSRAAALATIARHGPLSPSELAAIERISRPTTTRLVARLREQGLVECSPAPGDGRSYVISLSENGSALRKLRRARKQAYIACLLDRADPADVELLDAAARVLLRLLEEDA